MDVRQLGVEEELLLVDPETEELVAVAREALHGQHQGPADPEVTGELFQQQIETNGHPCRDLDDLVDQVQEGRRLAAEAAESAGAAVVAAPVPLLPHDPPEVSPKSRYREIVDRYARVARGAVACGMHVHVDVRDEEEAVRVADRLRPWLPVLLAVSANSPFCRGEDTGYASWRHQVWGQWPAAGPREPFGDVAGYHTACEQLIAVGAALDEGMLYLDVRPSATYPTVELRVGDVCTDVDDVVLFAALARGLVDTEAAGEREPEHWRVELLRAASWRAARYGLTSTLLDPTTRQLDDARAVIERLVEHVAGSLTDAGDLETVHEQVERLLAGGTGATRQRRRWEETHSLVDVGRDLRERTVADFH